MISEEAFSLKEAKPFMDQLQKEISAAIEKLDIEGFIHAKGFDRKVRKRSDDTAKKWDQIPLFAFASVDVIKDILNIVFKEAVEEMSRQSIYHDADEVWIINVKTERPHGSQIYSVRSDNVFKTGLYTVKFRQLAYEERDEFGFPFEIFEIVPRIGRGDDPVEYKEDWWCKAAR